MQQRVIVIGSSNTDLVVRGPRLPAPGESLVCQEFYQMQGGKGANQAVAAARLGLEQVTFVCAVGDDDFGKAARASYLRESLDCRYIKTVAGVSTGVALIMVDGQGENSIGVVMGANQHLTPDDIAAIDDETFNRADVLLTCLEMPLETVAASLKRAKNHGLKTVLNPAPAISSESLDELLPMVDVITPNQTEAKVYSAVDGHSPEDAFLAARELRGRGVADVIVTLGSAGCVYVGKDRQQTIPAPCVDAIDSTGAGDTFNGALAVALSEGREIVDAARWACRAGAISVTRKGAQPSLPYREEVLSPEA